MKKLFLDQSRSDGTLDDANRDFTPDLPAIEEPASQQVASRLPPPVAAPSANPATGAAHMIINLIADSTVASAPSGFAAAMQTAADLIGHAFSDNITINLRYGWGSFFNVVDPNLTGSGGAYANANQSIVSSVSYATARGWLAGSSTSADDASSVASLPANSGGLPGGDPAGIFVTSAQERAFGVFGGAANAIDGAVAFGTAVASQNWVSVALHEMTHAIGRVSLHYEPAPVLLDLFRFDAPGHLQWTEGNTTAAPAYFSANGGTTNLANYDTTSDYSDFLNDGSAPNDAFQAFYNNATLASLSDVDLRLMDVIGFRRLDDYAANVTTTGAVAVGGTATGNIETDGDHDWFRTVLQNGQTYRIDLNGTGAGLGTLPDSFLTLRDGSGNVLAANDDSGPGLDSRLFFTTSASAQSNVYYIDARGFGSNFGTYRVSVNQDDYAADAKDFSQIGTVAVGGSSTGVINYSGDHDWFRVSLTAGHIYALREDGTQRGGGSLTDTFLHLYSASSVLLGGNDDFPGAGLSSQLNVNVTTSGTFFIDAGAFSSNTGSYTIKVVDLGTSPVSAPAFGTADFGTSTGWSSQDTYPRHMADVNGDGKADIVGFGNAGVYVALSNGDGTFAAPVLELGNFGAGAGGWSNDTTFHRTLGDVNNDGKADIVGFGNAGVFVSLATGGGAFAAPVLQSSHFGANEGWSNDLYPRQMADVNGDGLADIVGFGNAGVYVSLGTPSGAFADPVLEVFNFGVGAGGWSSDTAFHREMADVNGDGKADIIGFGAAGAYVALATGGGAFAAPVLAINNFGSNSGWTSQDLYPRHMADINGDGMADIIGFGDQGVYAALATGGGNFAAPTLLTNNYGLNAGGWTNDTTYHREVADINGDHNADLVGFGASGTLVSTISTFITV